MAFLITTTRTLGDCVTAVAKRAGFASSVVDAAGSTDPAVVQMVTAVNDAAIELLSEGNWPDFVRVATITVAQALPGDKIYAVNLPADFFRFNNRTMNDVTALLPTRRPLNAEQWQSIATISPFVSFNLMWRYFNGQLQFLNPPAAGAGHTFSYEYISQAIIQDADVSADFKNVATKNGDIVLLDSFLVILLAVVKWRAMKGFDTAAAEAAYAKAFDARFNRQEAGKIVTLGGGDLGLFNPLSLNNLPETGFGT